MNKMPPAVTIEPPKFGAPVGGTEIPFRPVTPRPQPQPQPKVAPKKEEAPSRTLWFPSGKPTDGGGDKLDELAFLKSVTGSEAPAAPASVPTPKPRPSGGFTRQAEPIAPPPPARLSPIPQFMKLRSRSPAAGSARASCWVPASTPRSR